MPISQSYLGSDPLMNTKYLKAILGHLSDLAILAVIIIKNV